MLTELRGLHGPIDCHDLAFLQLQKYDSSMTFDDFSETKSHDEDEFILPSSWRRPWMQRNCAVNGSKRL